jgi:uncharacterized protein YlxW (UPF0749 family)
MSKGMKVKRTDAEIQFSAEYARAVRRLESLLSHVRQIGRESRAGKLGQHAATVVLQEFARELNASIGEMHAVGNGVSIANWKRDDPFFEEQTDIPF